MKNYWSNVIAGIWLLMISSLTVVFCSFEFLNADVIINSIMSLQKLTLYYWGQNRLLNILPFIVSPIKNPSLNLVAVLFFASVFHYCLLYLLSRSAVVLLNVKNKNEVSLKVFLITSLGFVIFFKPAAVFEIAIWHYEYTLSLLIFIFIGLRLGQNKNNNVDWWGVVAVGLAGFFAMGLNPSVLLPLIFWVCARIFYKRKISFNDAYLLGFGLFSFIIWNIISAKYGSAPYKEFNINLLPTSTQIVLTNMQGAINLPFFLVFISLFFGWKIIRFSSRGDTESSKTSIVVYVGNAAALFSLGWFLLFSASRWVELNQFSWRYFIYIYFVIFFMVSIHLAVYISKFDSGKYSRIIYFLPIVAILFLSPNLSWKNFDSYAIFKRIDFLAKSESNLYAGDYWVVWPSVFRDMMNGYESYGVTFRGEANEVMVRRYVENKILIEGYVTFYCLNDTVLNCMTQINKIAGPLLEIDSNKIGENLYVLKFKNIWNK